MHFLQVRWWRVFHKVVPKQEYGAEEYDLTATGDGRTVDGGQGINSAMNDPSLQNWEFTEDANFVVNDLILSEAVQISKQLPDEYANGKGHEGAPLKSDHANASACATPRTSTSPSTSLHGHDASHGIDSQTGALM